MGLKGRKIGHGRFVELRGHINKHLLQVKLSESALCKIPMKEIAATVVQIRAELARYLKGQTANKVIATLGRICIFAIERGDMKSNPVRDVDPLPTEEPRENYTPTADELNRVIENAAERYKPIIAFAAMSGLRLGELCALEWGDIDEEGNLKVQRSVYNYEIKTPKTVNGLRRIRLSEQAQKLLANWKEVAPKSAYVFPTTEGRMDGHDNWRVRGLHPACEKAGVTKFGWHGLRRFYINSLLDSGVPENHVQKLVGHAVGSNVTAKHYRRIRDEDVLQDGFTVSLPEGVIDDNPTTRTTVDCGGGLRIDAPPCGLTAEVTVNKIVVVTRIVGQAVQIIYAPLNLCNSFSGSNGSCSASIARAA